MRQLMDDVQNKNYILQEHISSLSKRGISTAHPHSMDDVIYQNMQRKTEDIIGEALVEISRKP